MAHRSPVVAAGPALDSRQRSPSLPAPYIAGRFSDGFWIILCPIFALAVMQALWSWSGLSDLAIFSILFGLIVTGHHMPGWIRAFGEPEVYRRHKGRLWVSVFAIPALVVLPTAFGLGAVALTIAATFDLWHVAMQQHGFGRIYAAKAGDRERRSARLDLACALVWYSTVVAWSDSWMQAIAGAFRKAGLPIFDLFTPETWNAVKLGLLVVSLALLAAYVHKAVRLWREHRISTTQKHVLHAVAFGVLLWSYQDASWYRANSVQNLFHAMQYFFMVWIYGNLSLRRDSTRPGRVYRTLFGRRAGMLLFGGLIALYGFGAIALSSSGYRLTGADAERTAQLIGSIGIASLLLHFYVDSFIWKVRSKEVRKALAIPEGEGTASTGPEPATAAVSQWRGAAHALAYFGIPALAIALLGARGRAGPAERAGDSIVREADLFPRSAMARYARAQVALRRGDRVTARSELETAIRLSPSFAGPAKALAALDAGEGKKAEAMEHVAAASAADPKDVEVRYHLASQLAQARRLPEAEKEYREIIRLRPDFAGAWQGLGVISKWRGDLGSAVPLFRKAAALDPNYSDAWCSLAGALATLGQTGEALAVVERYRERHPEDRVAIDLQRAIRGAEAQPKSLYP
ncbi:MAG: tetratricopeptide repeat protein [Acidobacteriota bacterium]